MKTIGYILAVSFVAGTSTAATVPSDLQGTMGSLTYSFSAEVTDVTDFEDGPATGFAPPVPVVDQTPFFGLAVGDVVSGLVEMDLSYGADFVDVLDIQCSFGEFNCTYGSFSDDSFRYNPDDLSAGTGSFVTTDFIDGSDISFGANSGSLLVSEGWFCEGAGITRVADLSFDSYEVVGLPHMPVPASLGFAFVATAAFAGLGVMKRKNGSKTI